MPGTSDQPQPDTSLSELFAEIIGSDMSEDAKTASFMAACIHKNYADYRAVVQPLLESAREENERLRHELHAVRSLVTQAYRGPCIPSAQYVIARLYPTAEQLAQAEKP